MPAKTKAQNIRIISKNLNLAKASEIAKLAALVPKHTKHSR